MKDGAQLFVLVVVGLGLGAFLAGFTPPGSIVAPVMMCAGGIAGVLVHLALIGRKE